MPKQTKILMGMPITVEIAEKAPPEIFDKVFVYFGEVDEKFSTYKETSEISRINKGQIKEAGYSSEMKEVFKLAGETKEQTNGYFDILTPTGVYDPSGLVKGWAIYKASSLLKSLGFKNFFIEAGGDIQVCGKNSKQESWSVGIRNPFNREQIVKIIYISGQGVATSGLYERGEHIYNPHKPKEPLTGVASLTVIGPNVYGADRFATPAFAMGKKGIEFIEQLEGFEGYQIDKNAIATQTSNFSKYTAKP